MNQEEIDKIFQAYLYGDNIYLWNLAGMEYNPYDYEEKKYIDKQYSLMEEYDIVLRKIAQEIEKGDFQYFLTKISEEEIDFFIDILLQTSKNEEKKKMVYNPEVDSFNKTKLIKTINKNEFTKKCILDRIYLEQEDIYNLISELNDNNFAIECVKKNILSSDNFTDYVVQSKNQQLMKNCIENNNEYGILSSDIFKLLKNIEDVEFIKKCIRNLNELKSISKVILILDINEQEFTEECIINFKEYKILYRYILGLLETINNLDIIKRIIKERNKIELSSSNIVVTLVRIDNKDFIKECMEKPEEYGINEDGLNTLKIIYDENYLNNKLQQKEYMNELDLPSEMTLGIEIESIGENVDTLKYCQERLLEGWKVKNDDSLIPNTSVEEGVEVISPILKKTNAENTEEIRRICTILTEVGQKSNESCGGHIHIGADYFKNVESWKNFIDICSNSEEILYIISNKKGEVPRKGVFRFAEPVSGKLEEMIKSGAINLENENDLKNFKEDIKKFQMFICTKERRGKYRSINFLNIDNDFKKTIEFRIPNGTIDSDTWIANINLFGGIMRAAKKLSDIQLKNKEDITVEEMEMLNHFEKIRMNDINQEEKLESILYLAVNENNREIYRERYIINNTLIGEKKYFDKEIKSGLANGEIRLSRNTIKAIFFGNDRVLGTEVKKVEQDLKSKTKDKEEITK